MRIPLSAASPPHPFHRLPFQFAAPPPFSPLLRFGPFCVLSLCLLFFPLSSRPSPAAACAATGTRGGVSLSLSIRARRLFFLRVSVLSLLPSPHFASLWFFSFYSRCPTSSAVVHFLVRSFSRPLPSSSQFVSLPFLPASLLLLLSFSSSNRIRCSPPRRCLSVCPCPGSVTLSPSYMHRVSSSTKQMHLQMANSETKQKSQSPSFAKTNRTRCLFESRASTSN